jgi:RNA polymerase sigma-70 factor (ECF subfamily)
MLNTAQDQDNQAQNRAELAQKSKENNLIAQAKRGEEAAFGQLYDLYFQKIYKFVYFRVNHKETAEDIAEEVFIKAWTSILHVKAESFGGWLYQIAKNKVIDHYRQKKLLIDLSEVEAILESEENVVDTVNTVMEQKVLMRLLKKLTPEQQIVIKLKFLEGLENDEISELISRSEGSIRVTQHRAVQKLQDLLNKELRILANNTNNKRINAEN